MSTRITLRAQSPSASKVKPNKVTRPDLTGYAALLGEGFEAKIDLLSKIISRAHYPSLGRYKERLLTKVIREFIPRSFDVGTGFVLFPHEDPSPPGGSKHHDPLNQSAFSLSRQCDLIVYEANTVPPVFRDEEFVVLRPEAVRAVIEVKGAIDISETDSILEAFFDFGRKWRATQLFYKSHYQPVTPRPSLFALAWRLKTKSDGKVSTNPTSIRERIVNHYKTNLSKGELTGFPLLDKLYIYGECEISSMGWSHKVNGKYASSSSGWGSMDGCFIRFNKDGKPYRDKDRTIASLLAGVHYSLRCSQFNRFFSYADETRSNKLVPYKHYGYSKWLETTSEIRSANTDTV